MGGSIEGAVFTLVLQECALVLQKCVGISFLVVRDEEMGEGGEGELESKGVKKFWRRGSRDETGQASCSSYLFPLDCCYPALVPRGQALCLRLFRERDHESSKCPQLGGFLLES